MEVALPDGTVVLARGRLNLVESARPRAPDYAIYLDERWAGDEEVRWPHEMIAWPDFGLPVDEAALFAAIVDCHDRAHAGELVEVACYGGVGRTGTVLGCLAVLAGVAPSAAVAWVREHYHRSAVEIFEQSQLIDRFARARGSQ